MLTRRRALAGLAALPLVAAAGRGLLAASPEKAPGADRTVPFEIGVQSWAFHMSIWRQKLDPLDLAQLVRDEYDVGVLEWSSGLLRGLAANQRPQFDAPTDPAVARAIRRRCDDAGVRCSVITCDGTAVLGHALKPKREEAIAHYVRWAAPAAELGCSGIRINLYTNLPHGPKRYAESLDVCAEGVAAVLERTAGSGVDVLVENHGGLSSRGDWLVDLVERVDDPRLGVILDFNNFRYDLDLPFDPDLDSIPRWYDRQRGVRELAPFASSVSGKSFAFDHTGWEATLDYPALMGIVLDAGFRGVVAAEYEGPEDPVEGTRKTIQMLRRLQTGLAPRAVS